MSENESEQWLLDEICAYVEDDKRKYAIAIEGPWGSGKTRFLNSALCSSLKDRRKRMVRVSMFGLKDADELYGKLGAVLMRLESDGGGKLRKVLRRAASGLPKVAFAAMSAVGIPLNGDMGAKLVVDLLLSDKHVLVFDDVERRSGSSDDLSLFGAVNELVEGRGVKVVFVAQGLGDGAGGRRSFDADIREKLVWKVYSYNQSPVQLVGDIFGQLNRPVGGIDVLQCVQEAVARSECSNARAMLRVEQMVAEVVDSGVLEDESIFIENRRLAFIDLVQFALMVCGGGAPREPSPPSGEGKSGFFNVEYWAAHRLYEQYRDIPCVEAYFCPRKSGGRIDLDGGIRSYIEKRYPNSRDTQAVFDIKSVIESKVGTLSDQDVSPIVFRLSNLIRRKEFSPIVLRDVVHWNLWFSEHGFEDAVPVDELVSCCERAMDRELQRALEFSTNQRSAFSLGEPADSVLARLSEYAVEAYASDLAKNVAKCVSGGGSADEILRMLSESLTFGVQGLLSVEPSHIASAYFNLAPEGQEELRRVVHKLETGVPIPDGAKDRIDDWLSALKNALNEYDDTDRMTRVRKGWFIQTIDGVLGP